MFGLAPFELLPEIRQGDDHKRIQARGKVMSKKWGLLVGLWMLVGSGALRAQDPSNVHYVYDAAGQLVGSVDANGNAKAYTYDAAGNLTAAERLRPRGDVD